MTQVVNPEIKFQVCHWQHQQRISRFIIRVWNATVKHNQALVDHWFGRVPLHHICCEFYSTGYFRISRENIWRWHQEDGCVGHCSISGFPQSHLLGNTWLPFWWQHDTEHNLWGDWTNTERGFCGSQSVQESKGADNDVVAGRGGYRACRSVLTQSWVCSITRCVAKLILNCWHWDQSFIAIIRLYPCTDLETTLCFSTTNYQVRSVRICQHSFMQTLLTHALDPTEALIPTLL